MERSEMSDNRGRKERRVSISLSPEQHAELNRMAKRKRVSLAWVVRDAIDKLLAAEAPLFRVTEQN